MYAVQRNEGPFVSNRETQDRLVWQRLPSPVRVGESHDVVAKATQFFDHRQREVFVREETCHDHSRRFVFPDLCRNLILM